MSLPILLQGNSILKYFFYNSQSAKASQMLDLAMSMNWLASLVATTAPLLRPTCPLLFKFRPFNDRTVFLRVTISILLAVASEKKQTACKKTSKKGGKENLNSAVRSRLLHAIAPSVLALVTPRGLGLP